MPKALDLLHTKFGRLTAIELVPVDHLTGKRKAYVCRCDCGRIKTIGADPLKNGRIRSCGCLHSEVAATRFRTHGLSRLKENEVWRAIKQRCENPKHPGFHDYGGRGIKMCSRWRNSFVDFLSDVGRRPSSRHTIERINNNGSYEPENVRWATPAEQSRNTRQNRMITYNGQTLCVRDWSIALGVTYMTLWHRIDKGLWP